MGGDPAPAVIERGGGVGQGQQSAAASKDFLKQKYLIFSGKMKQKKNRGQKEANHPPFTHTHSPYIVFCKNKTSRQRLCKTKRMNPH